MGVPVYVEIDDYQDVLDIIDVIKTNLIEAKRRLQDIHNLRMEENKELHFAKQKLHELQTRVKRIEDETTIR